MSEEENKKKIVIIGPMEFEIPKQINVLAIPSRWIHYHTEYFDNETYKNAFIIDPAIPRDNWIKLKMYVGGSILFNEKEDLGITMLTRESENEPHIIYLYGDYLAFERSGVNSEAWNLTKNTPEAFVYKLSLKDYVRTSCENVEITDTANVIDYMALCFENVKDLRLYLILPTKDLILPTNANAMISIRRDIDEKEDTYFIFWNNGAPKAMKVINDKDLY